jgi:hypothetical protein
MTVENGPGPSGDVAFTAGHAAELRALLAGEQSPENVQSQVPSLTEKKLPGYEGAPLGLDPIENDSRFQGVMANIEPLRAEEAALYQAYTADLSERDAGGQGSLSEGQLDYSRKRRAELHQLSWRILQEQATPILRERLAALASLPIYYGSPKDQEASLVLEPAVPRDDRLDYGPCDVDVERIVATPSHDNWAGTGYRKVEGESPDLIIGHALNMLSGDYRSNDAGMPIVSAAIDNLDNYVYLTEDGIHRIGAAKLLGRKTFRAKVKSYNYTSHDSWARDVDSEQRAHQRNLGTGGQ